MRWRLKSPALRLFIQSFMQAQIKKKPSKFRVTGLCAGTSPLTGEFPAQRASNAINMFPFDDVIICICILKQVFGTEMAQTVKFLARGRERFILQCKYDGCWWHGDAMSQGTGMYGIGHVFQEYLYQSPRMINPYSTGLYFPNIFFP